MNVKDGPLTHFLVVVPAIVLVSVLVSGHVQEAVLAPGPAQRAPRLEVDPMVALTHSTLRQCVSEPPGEIPALPRTLRPQPVRLEVLHPGPGRAVIPDGSPYVVLVDPSGQIERVWPVFRPEVARGSTAYHEAVIGGLAKWRVPKELLLASGVSNCLVLVPRLNWAEA